MSTDVLMDMRSLEDRVFRLFGRRTPRCCVLRITASFPLDLVHIMKENQRRRKYGRKFSITLRENAMVFGC